MKFKPTQDKIIITLCISLIMLSIQLLTSYSPNRVYDISKFPYGVGFSYYLEAYLFFDIIVWLSSFILIYFIYSLFQKNT